MLAMGLVPNINIYNLLISGYCKQGKIEEASTLLFEMEKWSILPDGFMFESLIKGHCKICNMEAALTLWEQDQLCQFVKALPCFVKTTARNVSCKLEVVLCFSTNNLEGSGNFSIVENQ